MSSSWLLIVCGPLVNAGPKLTVRMKTSPAAAVLTQKLTDLGS